jgi:hypothetical protein
VMRRNLTRNSRLGSVGIERECQEIRDALNKSSQSTPKSDWFHSILGMNVIAGDAATFATHVSEREGKRSRRR